MAEYRAGKKINFNHFQQTFSALMKLINLRAVISTERFIFPKCFMIYALIGLALVFVKIFIFDILLNKF